MKPTAKAAVIGALAVVFFLAVFALLTIFTGSYNVAATERPNPVIGWALDTTMHKSVGRRAGDITPPPEFTPAMIEAGASEYKEYCAHCHGGVGEGRAEWVAGMRPHPPALARTADQWSEREGFWMVKRGIKMSGMPAFGPTHDDQALWNIAAFVKAMPDMTAERYARFNGGHEQ